MYQIGTQLISRTTRNHAVVENVVTTRKGTLFTVLEEDGSYKRYYESRLADKYGRLKTNVLPVDFVLKRLVS